MRRFAVGDSTSERSLLEESDEPPVRFRFERVVADLVVAEALRVDRVDRTGTAFFFCFAFAFLLPFSSAACFFLFSLETANRFAFASASFFICAADFWYLRLGCVATAASVFSFLLVVAPFSNPLVLPEGADGPAAAAVGEAGGGTNGRQRTEFARGCPECDKCKNAPAWEDGRRGVARRTHRLA